MQVRKQRLELDMEQQTGSKSGMAQFVALQQSEGAAKHSHAPLENHNRILEKPTNVALTRDGGRNLSKNRYLRL